MSVPGGPDLSVPDASVPDASVPDASAAPPFCWRRERWLFGGVFLAAFALYAVTAARYVGLEDDAIFIGALHFWGISHPPGYPAHTLLGGIFYHLIPFGSPAFKAHLFSGFAAAAACVSLYIVVRMLSVGRAVAVFAALAFAASLDFWSQAVIAEVYTLNMFFFFTLIALCVGYARSGARRWIFAAAVVFGVGMANHYPLLCLGAAGLLILIAAPMRRRPLDIIGCAALAVVAAAPFYLWMVWRSHGDVVYNFYGPINDFAAFEFYFLRRGYAGVDNQLGSDWRDKLEFLTYFGGRMLRQFTPFGFLLVVIGFFAMALHRPLHRRRGLHRLRRLRRVWVALLVSFLASSVVLIFLVNFNAGVLTFAIFRPYFLPAYGVMAIWLAFGAEAVASVVLRVLRYAPGVGVLLSPRLWRRVLPLRLWRRIGKKIIAAISVGRMIFRCCALQKSPPAGYYLRTGIWIFRWGICIMLKACAPTYCCIATRGCSTTTAFMGRDFPKHRRQTIRLRKTKRMFFIIFSASVIARFITAPSGKICLTKHRRVLM